MLKITADSEKGTMSLEISGTGSTIINEMLSVVSEIYQSLAKDGLEGAAFAALLESMLHKDKYWEMLHTLALKNSENSEEESEQNDVD